MTDKTIVPMPVSEDDIKEFIKTGAVFNNKTYNTDALVAIGLTFMKNNFHGYVNKYGLKKRRDIFGKTCILGEELVKMLEKKA